MLNENNMEKYPGERIYLKQLMAEDVTPEYLLWMQDKKVTEFLECRWDTFTLDGLKEYVRSVNESSCGILLGIFLKDKNSHIGNIKIGNINHRHRFADLGLIIGDKKEWGRGYATEAIQLATKYAFDKLKLNKLIAGIYSNNIGSYKAFMKSGYREVGRMKEHRCCNGLFTDEILVEKCRKSGF